MKCFPKAWLQRSNNLKKKKIMISPFNAGRIRQLATRNQEIFTVITFNCRLSSTNLNRKL
jgi:hypothetical protein